MTGYSTNVNWRQILRPFIKSYHLCFVQSSGCIFNKLSTMVIQQWVFLIKSEQLILKLTFIDVVATCCYATESKESNVIINVKLRRFLTSKWNNEDLVRCPHCNVPLWCHTQCHKPLDWPTYECKDRYNLTTLQLHQHQLWFQEKSKEMRYTQ